MVKSDQPHIKTKLLVLAPAHSKRYYNKQVNKYTAVIRRYLVWLILVFYYYFQFNYYKTISPLQFRFCISQPDIIRNDKMKGAQVPAASAMNHSSEVFYRLPFFPTV